MVQISATKKRTAKKSSNRTSVIGRRSKKSSSVKAGKKRTKARHKKKKPKLKVDVNGDIAVGSFIVQNYKGLHTRPSTELVKCAIDFSSSVVLRCKNGNFSNAKCLLEVLMMVAMKGTKVHVEAEGPDSEKAVKAILELATNSFNVQY